MDFLAIFTNTWISILLGIFFLSMVVGCSFDRQQKEDGKWWVFGVGAVLTACYFWFHDYRPSIDGLKDFFSVAIKPILIYLAIGLGYSIVEFMLDVRRSVKYWTKAWAQYMVNNSIRSKQVKHGWNSDPVEAEEMITPAKELANGFVSENRYSRKIIDVAYNKDATDNSKLVIPVVNKSELGQAIGCWMIFWPFYLVSLILGDLITMVAETLANFIASISGRFVRMSFANVFKFDMK